MTIPPYAPHDPRSQQASSSPRSSFKDRDARPVNPAKRNKWPLFGGLALVAVLGGWYYLSGGAAPEDGAGAGRGGRGAGMSLAAPVRVTAAERREMPVVERTIGTVVSVATVSVTARVQGQLVEAHFREGQMVKAGDLLFTIDQRPFQAAVAQARAALARDQAQAADAARDKERYATLTEQGAASNQQRDKAATSAEALASTVTADRAALQIAELNLSFTQIRSPIDGKTGPILIQPGNIVNANSANPLVVISQIQPIKVSFALPQTDLPLIQRRQGTAGLIATVTSHTVNGRPLTAAVDFVGNAVAQTSGTIELRATFPNWDGALVPGQLVDVVVELDNIRNALVVPRTALNDGPTGSYVYVVENERAEQRDIKVLFDDNVNVAIEGNVNPGDQVITEGQLRVVPGQPVTILGAREEAGADTGGRSGGGQASGRRGQRGAQGAGGQGRAPRAGN